MYQFVMGKCYVLNAKEHTGWDIVEVSLETQSTMRGTNAIWQHKAGAQPVLERILLSTHFIVK